MPKYDALCPMHQRRLITAWSVQLPGLAPSRNTSAEDVFRCSLITLLRGYEMSCFGEASIAVLAGGDIAFENQTARSSVSLVRTTSSQTSSARSTRLNRRSSSPTKPV
jgi:hypothetical protein